MVTSGGLDRGDARVVVIVVVVVIIVTIIDIQVSIASS